MNERVSLLPANRTAYEDSLDLSGARVDGLPVDIPKLIDPQQIPLKLLPWLAWSMRADMWRDDWSEQKKRWVAAQSLGWHYKKGTANLLRKYTEVMGGEVRYLETPPDKTFMMPAYNEAERLTFLRRFPEVRLYPYVARAFNKFSHFTSAAYGRSKAFVGACYVHDNGAWSRYARTSELRDQGTVTPLTYRTVTNEYVGSEFVSSFEEIVLPAKATDKIILNASPKDHQYFGTIGYVGERLIRIKRDITLGYSAPREQYNAITPGLGFINVAPDNIFEKHSSLKGSKFLTKKQFLTKAYLPPTIAWRYIYERWYLFDPTRMPDQRKRSKHLGYTRLGLPAYWAEARIRMNGQQRRRETWRFVNGYLRQHSTDNIDRTVEAVRQSKALRDKILVNTKTRRQVRVGDRNKLGQFAVGQFVNI